MCVCNYLPGVYDEVSNIFEFFRANTNDSGNFPKGKRSEVGAEQEQIPIKHAHFSSAESIENGKKFA